MSELLLDDIEDDEEDVGEEDVTAEPCPCLFCSAEQPSALATLAHCKTEHGVDLLLIATELGSDFYSCIKLINYIRKESPVPSSLVPLPLPPFPWDDDSYYHPVLEQDPLLQVDWETTHPTTSLPHDSTSEGGELSCTERLRISERKTEECKAALLQALDDLQSMKLAMRQMIEDKVSELPNRTATTHPDSDSDRENEEEEDGYFSTYSHFSIHHEMLSDRVRTGAYQNFISRNTSLFKDKVVLDIGCGTGILSLFAAQSGAKQVIGVDQSTMIYNAMEIIRENGYEDKITLIRGKVEEVHLPIDKVDIVLSEWMGYFLLFESMLDTVIFARDKWLKDTTHVYPNMCSIKVVAMSDKNEWETRIDFWENVYGFKMSCVKSDILREASVQCVDPTSIISTTYTLKEFDVSTVAVGELEFEEPFELTVQQDTVCHAIVGYFEAGFVGPHHTEVLKTGPQDTPTHWKQTVLYLQDPIPVHIGDVMKGSVAVARNKQDLRSLDITLTLTLSPYPQTQSDTKHHTHTKKYTLR